MTYEHQTQKQELENEEQAGQLESLTDRWYVLLFFNHLFQNKKVPLVRCAALRKVSRFLANKPTTTAAAALLMNVVGGLPHTVCTTQLYR